MNTNQNKEANIPQNNIQTIQGEKNKVITEQNQKLKAKMKISLKIS